MPESTAGEMSSEDMAVVEVGEVVVGESGGEGEGVVRL